MNTNAYLLVYFILFKSEGELHFKMHEQMFCDVKRTLERLVESCYVSNPVDLYHALISLTRLSFGQNDLIVGGQTISWLIVGLSAVCTTYLILFVHTGI